MSSENVNTFDKRCRRIVIVHGGLSGTGRILRTCRCPECAGKPRHERYRVPPCGCHGLVVICTCGFRDVACRHCGKVFVASAGDWWEVPDPHRKGKDGAG